MAKHLAMFATKLCGWRGQGRAVLVRGVLAFIILAAVASVADASVYSGLYVFGDSLSDGGNGYWKDDNTITDIEQDIYWNNRWSNGSVWCEYLATKLGLSSLVASTSGGTNYAVGGAETSDTLLQVTRYLASVGGVVDSSALYVVWAGPNNFLHTTSLSQNPTSAQLATCESLLASWVNDIVEAVNTLIDAGAESLLVPNMIDLGDLPWYADADNKSELSALVSEFNSLLAEALAEIAAANPDVTIYAWDAYSFVEDFFADPSAYGFTNATDSAEATHGDPDTYAFWDYMHPTTAFHELMAETVYSIVTPNQAVPEPNTMALWGLGAMCLMGVRSVRRTKR